MNKRNIAMKYFVWASSLMMITAMTPGVSVVYGGKKCDSAVKNVENELKDFIEELDNVINEIGKVDGSVESAGKSRQEAGGESPPHGRG